MGVLNLIIFSLGYIRIDLGIGTLGYVAGSSLNGYGLMELWSMGFFGVMTSLTQVFIVILTFALLIWGVLGLLQSFGVVNILTEALSPYYVKKISKICLRILLALNGILLIWMIFLIALNGDNSVGLGFSVGLFIEIIFTLASLVLFRCMDIKEANQENK
jgi:hypothetical protein